MPPALLRLRLLALPLAVFLLAPTLGTTGTDGASAPDAATAALALAPADAPSGSGGTAAPSDPAADAAPAEPSSPEPKAQKAEKVEKAEAPRKDAEDQTAEKAQGADTKAATADEPQKDEGAKGPTADAPRKGDTGQKVDAAPAKDTGQAAAPKPPEKDGAKGAKAESAGKKARAAAAANPDVPPRTLYLAVGHGRAPNGRRDPGAENTRTGAFEIDSAQVMVDAMVEVLREAPNLQLEFESGDHPNVIGSVGRANALGVDDCIEVHQDMAAAPPGVFAHWYPGAKAANRLADRMVSSVADQGVGVRHDWHRPRPGLYFLRKTTCRAVLIEVGRVGDFDVDQLRTLGVTMARAYLADTKKARGIGG